MITVRVCSNKKNKLKIVFLFCFAFCCFSFNSRLFTKSVAFTSTIGKNPRYFVGVFNKTIIPLALVRLLIIANSYPTRTRGVIVKYTSEY